ncbi:hypothetical protein [Amycolatopsis pittospori]|uniref:hypothetical protein n=1 Tax=Amycolatopsis pittospori TaxID=2749434 RepID=UPI0015EFF60C|nr:hypothetical protein [Amycolatopsis pittospori]
METTRPTPEEAASALRDIEEAQASLARVPPPWWYFIALAALLAVTPFVQLTPSTPAGAALGLGGLTVWTALFGITIGSFIRRSGVVPRLSTVSVRRVLLVLAFAAVVMLGAMVTANVLDQVWIWFIGSGVLACLTLALGAKLRKQARDR